MDLQGRIEKFTLPEILQLVAASRKSGTLGIQREDSIVMIYFDAGDIVYGYGPRQTYHLGQLLRERGKLTNEQLETAVTTQAQTENSRRLGEILISRGYIDRADLQEVVQNQIEELLYSLLSWESGSFKFYEDQFPTEEEIKVRLSVENVILEGLRRLDERNLVGEAFPSMEKVYTISASQAGRSRSVDLQASEWNVMALVDGNRSLREVCRLSPLNEEETMHRLAQLKLAGLITPTEPGPKSEEKGSELEQRIDRLGRLLEEYLTEKAASRPMSEKTTSRPVPQNPRISNEVFAGEKEQ